jgi:hypothetical protein
MLCKTLHDLCEIACSSCRGSFPAPTISRSTMNLGIAPSFGLAAGRAGCTSCRDLEAGEGICIEANAPTRQPVGGERQGQMSRISAA